MRESYHQNVGNPIQRESLPNTLPDTEFPAPDPSPDRIRRMIPATVFAGTSAWMLSRLLCGVIPDGYAFLAVVVLWSVYATLRVSLVIGNIIWYGSLLLILVAWSSQPITVQYPVWRAISAYLLGWLGSELLLHGSGFATCSPLLRVDREVCRQRWLGYSWVVRLAPAAASLASESLAVPHFAEGFLGIWCLISLALALRTSSFAVCRTVAWETWRSWLTYNPTRQNAPGVWQARTPQYWLRVILLAIALYVLAHAHARSPWVGHWARDLAIEWFLLVAVPISLALPVLVEAQQYRGDPASPAEWERIIHGVRTSAEPIERDSVYLGRVVEDGSPVLVPRSVYREHAHILGDSGSGKTSLGLLPILEQLIAKGDCSFVVIDMKGDSGELLATLQSAAERVRAIHGRPIPVKHFTNRSDRSTFAFNMLTQPFWHTFEPYDQSDLTANAVGANYGTGYGPGYFSSINMAMLFFLLTKYPKARTFRDLAERAKHALATANKRELRDEVKQAAGHMLMILDRLGTIDALNVGPDDPIDEQIRQQAMDFTTLFREPSIFYFHLSATLTPGIAPEIGRLAIASLLSAAAQSVDRRQVYLVIDEFQRVVAHNLAALLQQARSLNIGVILANQSMQDLKTPDLNMIPSLEANCRLRQWFAVSSSDDRKRLSEGSGQTIEQKTNRDFGILRPEWVWLNKVIWPHVSISEDVKPRISENEVMLMTDNPNQSILTITRGAGFAQYGGFPVLLESHFHIPETEYKRRRMMPWPGAGNGAFVPRDEREKQPAKPTRKPGPTVTGEVVGGGPASDDFLSGLDELLGFHSHQPPRQQPRFTMPEDES